VRDAVPVRQPVRVPVRLCRRGVDGLVLKEGLEDGGRVLERVVDDVDEVVFVHDLSDEGVGFRSFVVEFGPLTTDRLWRPNNKKQAGQLCGPEKGKVREGRVKKGKEGQMEEDRRTKASSFQAINETASTMVG
jgi:hypothetical protein